MVIDFSVPTLCKSDGGSERGGEETRPDWVILKKRRVALLRASPAAVKLLIFMHPQHSR